jgi:hypothetical protein
MIDMKLLSREEALQKCKKQWLWVAETGKHKSNYPFEDGRPLYSCYACEYSVQDGDKFCYEKCIVPWPGGGCLESKSPYKDYMNAPPFSEESKEAALAIAALCDKGLSEINQK